MTSKGNIGRYEVLRELGRGGMASVLHARDPRFRREVAVKLLPRELLHDAKFKARFEREAQTIGSLEHFAIAPVYDFGEQDGQPYLVMRYMPGGSLDGRLSQSAFPLPDAVAILQRIASALDYAHNRGVIHRDLKPGNILFDEFGNAFLSDFGVAQLAEATLTLTGTGAIIGTPAYMSPEQVQGDIELDPRCDIYALGVILFEMLTGRQPYKADTPAKLMMKHILEPVPLIREVVPDLPAGANQVLIRALAKDREARYSSAGEFAEAARGLTKAQSEQAPEPAGSAGLRKKQSRPRTLVVGDSTPAFRRLADGLFSWARAAGGLTILASLAMLVSGGVLAYGAIRRPTDTPTPTVTATPESATASPTSSASPTSPPPAPSATTNVTSLGIRDDAVCRAGPGTQYDAVGYLTSDEVALALGQNEAASWWWIEIPGESIECWISDALVSYEGGRPTLPILTPVPIALEDTVTATEQSTRRPNPTATPALTEVSRNTPEPTDPVSEPICPTPEGEIQEPC